MKHLKAVLVLSFAFAFMILACGVTFDLGSTPTPAATQRSSLDQLATFVAQTVQAVSQTASSATPTHTATATNPPMPATLSVSVATTCYAGPRTNYGFVITIYPGTTVTVVGKDTVDNYWIIDVPNYPGTVCWLSGQYASLNGDTASLPVPATPVISVYTLNEPRNLHYSCTSVPLSGTPEPWWHNASEWTIVLRWANTDADQTGVRVYRNGYRLATLHGHATSYTDTFIHYGHHDDDNTYGVQAANSTEISSIVTIDVHHCN